MPWKSDLVAIINRGEPAMRLIRAVRDHNHRHGASLRTLALYTDPDRGALCVRQADQAVGIGPALSVDPRDGKRKSTYLHYDLLERVLVQHRVGAVWVGWGFVSEHAAFADLCDRLGVVFLGPPGEVMRRLGDKIASKLLAEAAEVPVAPWSGGAVGSAEDARRHAERIGFPLMVKATAGGGGRGIRRVDSLEQLGPAVESAQAEAAAAFGDPAVFLEKMVASARHVEVQCICDGQGGVWTLGTRDCSVQRKHQKLIEEAPAPGLSDDQHRRLLEASARLCRMVGYRGAGTVEYLVDPATGDFAFMEVNARLQVEHPITECVTGADLVGLQLHVGLGGRLEGEPPPSRGSAVEVRLNAEDPDNNLAQSPGTVVLYRPPVGPGVRLDSGVEAGDAVSPEFDSMVAKIIAYGADRLEAISRLERALRESTFVLGGGATNKALLAGLLAHPDFRAGPVDTGWFERLLAAGGLDAPRTTAVALLVAAVEAYQQQMTVARGDFWASAHRGRPAVADERGLQIELGCHGGSYSFFVRRLDRTHYVIAVDGEQIRLEIEPFGPYDRSVHVGDARWRAVACADGPAFLVEVDGVPTKVSRADGGLIRAPAPSVVVSVSVQPGDHVRPGDRLLVLEAMKTETAIVARYAGVVSQVLTRPNVQVPQGAPLLKVDAHEQAASTEPHLRFQFNPGPARDDLAQLRSLLLGYDLSEAEARALPARLAAGADDPGRIAAEDELLSIFVDHLQLFDHRPAWVASGQRLSPEQCLFVYLRATARRGEGLPAAFVSTLERAVAHAGVTSLDPSLELDQALFRIFRARLRRTEAAAALLGLLERRLAAVDRIRGHLSHGLIDRFVEATRFPHPALHACAQELRYRAFEHPVLEELRQRDYAAAEADIARFADGLDPAAHAEVVARLVVCPQTMKRFLSGRFHRASPAGRRGILEVMLRRYYRIRPLEALRTEVVAGFELARATYDHDGRRIDVLAAHPRPAELPALLAALRPLLGSLEHDDVALDLYLWCDEPCGDADAMRDHLLAQLDAAELPRRPGQLVVAMSGATSHHYTFVPGPAGFREEATWRDLHPMVGRRMGLQRLLNFELQRLPSADDVILLRGTARQNPKDERLFAFCEVRDLTVVHAAETGRPELPALRRVFMEAVAAMRRVQWARAERLRWNRIYLHLWPVLTLSGAEMGWIVQDLQPETAGLGLEKVVVAVKLRGEAGVEEVHLEIANPGGAGAVMRREQPKTEPLRPLDRYTQNVVSLKQRGLLYPYELIKLVTPSGDELATAFPPGRFTEHELEGGRLVPVSRPYGQNVANVVVGVIESFTQRYPEGMKRVAVFGDPSRNMGSLAEPECARILAALDLAEELGVPLEWYAVSAGARISMDSGTENMDWIARVLRRLVNFTQAGHTVHVLVLGINVGAQPYWNAEATMLMHTKGILVMTPDTAMVLTGKDALDYSGGVSADDNVGIGGYERIMGPNGQAQFLARDIPEACQILLRHYEHSYVAPGERFPRRAATADPIERDVCQSPHGRVDGTSFETLGEVFSEVHNPGRKKPFDIRAVLRGTVDQDHKPMERWGSMRDAEVAVVWDAHLGGWPVVMIGIESRPLDRLGFVPADGPSAWTGGTLFPQASKKVARAINSASGNRPVVVLANLSGFDGSPESLRQLQLEYGAEIGRAVVNFRGPLIFCVISRYHGGAFVVFSAALSDSMEVSALEGAHASVIGGAPAAAVVFAREVKQRTRGDARVAELAARVAAASGPEAAALRRQLAALNDAVHSEKLGELAAEFDEIHDVRRALRVGSVQRIVSPPQLRPYLIDAVERGIARG